MARYKPVGWRNDNYRHSLAAKGIRSTSRVSFYMKGQTRDDIVVMNNDGRKNVLSKKSANQYGKAPPIKRGILSIDMPSEKMDLTKGGKTLSSQDEKLLNKMEAAALSKMGGPPTINLKNKSGVYVAKDVDESLLKLKPLIPKTDYGIDKRVELSKEDIEAMPERQKRELIKAVAITGQTSLPLTKDTIKMIKKMYKAESGPAITRIHKLGEDDTEEEEVEVTKSVPVATSTDWRKRLANIRKASRVKNKKTVDIEEEEDQEDEGYMSPEKLQSLIDLAEGR